MTLGNYFLIEYDVENGSKEDIDISSDVPPTFVLSETERVAKGYYQKVLDKHVEKLYHKEDDRVRRTILKSDIPNHVLESLESEVTEHIDCEYPLGALSEAGTPDLFVCDKSEPHEFEFVEVKGPNEDFTPDQKKWIPKFDFLPVKVVYVYNDRSQWLRHKSKDFSDKYKRAISKPEPIGEEERPDMSQGEIAEIIDTVEIGDLVRFNDLKGYLEVTEMEATMGHPKEVTGIKLEGSQNREYVLSKAGDWCTNGGYRKSLDWVEIRASRED
ncbi:VRR-NUC domain-containing protein [Haloferax sp. YSMS24]|uniref:VRR-NUC domain-containing protein n=1 Tax=Haloferax sp. YSMS24 TaxID=3388425 RepID=UPI00398D53CE